MYEVLWCSSSGNAGTCNFPPAIDLCVRLSHLLVCINSSVNCAFYYFPGKVFRQAWKETYSCCFGWQLPSGMAAVMADIPGRRRRRTTEGDHQRYDSQERTAAAALEDRRRSSQQIPLRKTVFNVTSV